MSCSASPPSCRAHLIRPAFIALGAFLLFLFFLKQVADFDLWFHLAVGRETFAAGRIPERSFSIVPLFGEPERFYEWGYGLLLYFIHSIGGVPALSYFNAACGATTVGLLAFSGQRREAPDWRHLAASAAAAVVIAAIIDFRLVVRPEIVLFVAMAATVFILESFLRDSRRRVLAALPIVAWALAMLHPSPIFLIVIVACYVIHLWVGKRHGDARALALAVVAMAGATCLNPYGIRQLALPFFFALDSRLMSRVVEFDPIISSPALAAYVGLLLAVVPALCFRATRRVVDLLLVGIFAVAAFRYARNLGLLAIVCYLPLRSLVAHALERAGRQVSFPALRVASMALLGAAVLALGNYRVSQGDWGAGLRPGVFPALPEFVRDQRTAGLASLFQYGGYLNWTSGKPVLADGRNYTYNAAFAAHDVVFAGKPGWDVLLDRYQIDAIFTPAIQPAGGRPVPLLANLFQSAAWQLAALDETGLWFVRTSLLAPENWLDKRLIWRRILVDEQKRGIPGPVDDPLLRHARRFAGDELARQPLLRP